MILSEALLTLTRLGIGNQTKALIGPVDWVSIKAIAERQGLSAIVLDGIEKLPNNTRPPQGLLLEWIGDVLQNYESRYGSCRQTIAEMAKFYNSHGYKLMVLKGFACSLDWPKPNHRPCGDIDIWQFGEYKKADDLVVKEKGIKVDNSHHHHTVFYWRDFVVENHYDFINVHDFRSSRELEVIFKKLGEDETHLISLCGERVYLPSPNLHALFLLRHNVSHFASSNINIRQVLDWGFFVEKHTKEVDWKWLMDLLDKYHMKDFFNCLNAICVDDLGFSPSVFPEVRYLPDMKEKVLSDILNPSYEKEEPVAFIPRMLYKYKRWQGNGWKQKLCYSESRWESFWMGLWAHLLKPSSL